MDKRVVFIKETLWILYAIYFQPRSLDAYLCEQIDGLSEMSNHLTLSTIIKFRQQVEARRFLIQISCLVMIAGALPLLLLTIPSIKAEFDALLFPLLYIAGLGLASWQSNNALSYGILGKFLLVLLALSISIDMRIWRDIYDEMSFLNIALGVLIGTGVGGFFGGVYHLLSKKKWWQFSDLLREYGDQILLWTAGTTAGMMASVIANNVTNHVIVVTAFIFSFSIAGLVANTLKGFVASIVAGSVASIIVFLIMFMTLNPIAIIIAFIITFLTTSSRAFFLGQIVLDKFAWVIGGIVTITVAYVVASSLTLMANTFTNDNIIPDVLILKISFLILPLTIGWIVGSKPVERWQQLFFPFIFIVGSSFLFPPFSPIWILWLLLNGIGFFRLPVSLFHLLQQGRHHFYYLYMGRLDVYAAWRWDELIPFPLPWLDVHLAAAVKNNRTNGIQLIVEATKSWRQGNMARRALLQVTADTLATFQNEAEIARAHRDLNWLPDILPDTVLATVGKLRQVSRLIDDKINLIDEEPQLLNLAQAQQILDDLIRGFSFVPKAERLHFSPVVELWRSILRMAQTRLPNPYVAGLPLQKGGKSLFMGRKDVMQELQTRLANRVQRPTLLLYGQRRMGKSSLLYQLADKLDDQVVPIYLDCQAPEATENDIAFLRYFMRTVVKGAVEARGLVLPEPPSLECTTFSSFSEWREQVFVRLGSSVLLVAFDEFERLGEEVRAGVLSYKVLDLLRHLIQHHGQMNLLFVGSHMPRELGEPWSSYLINAITLQISYLQENEVRKLIEMPIPGFSLRYAPDAVARIIALTNCQPMLVQLMCQDIINLLNKRGERYATLEDVDAVIPSVLESGGSLYFVHLQTYMDSMIFDKLRYLAQKGMDGNITVFEFSGDDPARSVALEKLLIRDILQKEENLLRFEIELVRLWVKRSL